MSSIRRGRGALLSAGVALTLLAACTSETGSATTTPTSGPGSSSASGAELTRSESLTVITHDSFALSDEVKRQFESDTGMTVTYVAPGDAGSMVNQLILTKAAMIAGIASNAADREHIRLIPTDLVPTRLQPARACRKTPLSKEKT